MWNSGIIKKREDLLNLKNLIYFKQKLNYFSKSKRNFGFDELYLNNYYSICSQYGFDIIDDIYDINFSYKIFGHTFIIQKLFSIIDSYSKLNYWDKFTNNGYTAKIYLTDAKNLCAEFNIEIKINPSEIQIQKSLINGFDVPTDIFLLIDILLHKKNYTWAGSL